MKFSIYLTTKGSPSISNLYKDKAYEEDDDYRFVISDICNVLQTTGQVSFIVEGFPVLEKLSCELDLMCVMEEMPDILSNLQKNIFNFDVWFYEQGTEKMLSFSETSEESVKIMCLTLDKNSTNSPVIVIEKAEINRLFRNLYSNFVDISNIICPHLINHNLMHDFTRFYDHNN